MIWLLYAAPVSCDALTAEARVRACNLNSLTMQALLLVLLLTKLLVTGGGGGKSHHKNRKVVWSCDAAL